MINLQGFKLFHLISRGMHFKCLNAPYPRANNMVVRSLVPKDKISWEAIWPEYLPNSYTSPSVLAQPSYADPPISDSKFNPKWNEIDGNVNRKSHESTYEVVDQIPRNYRGRTGITGRGCLGRWGPNHAADPVVTRWKLDSSGNPLIHEQSGKKVLEFVSIERRDCGEWAIPGGMVDPGERVTATLRREFMEEALNSLEMTDDEKQSVKDRIEDVFKQGTEVYSGYVDDPRNTDNAWMETVAYNFHEDSPGGGVLRQILLTAGDDARAVRWSPVSQELNLYASHRDILARVAQKFNAHW